MKTDTSSILRKSLLLKNQDSTREEYKSFYEQLIRHRFSSLLHLYQPDVVQESTDSAPATISAETEIDFLLHVGQSHLFLENILYHLNRNKKVLPPALIPCVLGWIGNHPALLIRLYTHHPDLILALSQSHWEYLNRLFQSDITLAPGSPGYYDTLEGRMHLIPLRTANYIRNIFPSLNPHQQARLLEILSQDNSPDSREFLTSHVHHSRKPLREAALLASLRFKEKTIYDPIKETLVHHIEKGLQANQGLDDVKLPIPWKDLANLAGFTSREDILIALTDPVDYLANHKHLPESLNKSALIHAAIFHKSQKALYMLGKENPELARDRSFSVALDSKTAIAILHHLIVDPHSTFDQLYINLLERVHPFLPEDDTDVIWKKMTNQWANLPFTLEDLDMEILALRIHPNKIQSIWKDPVFQESAEILQKIRKILKCRLDFLKKCYK